MQVLSSGTRAQLGNVIRLTAEIERDTEVMRQLLAQLKNFEPYAAFTRLDRNNLGYLNSQCFELFLRYIKYLLLEKTI